MGPNTYLENVLANHATSSSITTAYSVIAALIPSLTAYANGHDVQAIPAGSIAKGTAIKDSSDVDILVSVSVTARETSQEVYEKLFNRLQADGFAPRKQNVSLGMTYNGLKVDIVPAKRQSHLHTVHNIWSHKKQSRRETDIHKHVEYVIASGRVVDIRLVKIWAKLHGLKFPSFPLEVAVIAALEGRPFGDPKRGFIRVLEYFRDELPTVRLLDPTKPSNVLSDELTLTQKNSFSSIAGQHLDLDWIDVLWAT